MDSINTINLAASLASLILAVIAIIFSVIFFIMAKRTESDTKSALEGVRSQTDALQKLAGRWLDRFTKHLVENKPIDALFDVAAQVSSLPERISQYLQINLTQTQQNRAELISNYLAIQYYSAMSNVFAQQNLPPLNELDDNNEYHQLIRQIVDSSAADALALESVIQSISSSEIDSNPLNHLRVRYQKFWASHVKDSLSHYQFNAAS